LIVVHIKDGVTLGDQQEISDARGHAQELQLAAVLLDQGAARDQLTDSRAVEVGDFADATSWLSQQGG
jgi:hypothetical protein